MSFALSDVGEDVLVSKRELALLLRVSRPTLDAWIDRYEGFPFVERGTNGAQWRFDPRAVIDFLRAKQEEQANRKALRDEQLAQLMLPLEEPMNAGVPNISIDDQIKATRLSDMRLAQAEKAGKLVVAADVSEKLALAFGELNRSLQGFVRQLGREHAWPEPIVIETERRLSELQRGFVAAAGTHLTPIEAEANVAHSAVA